MDLKEAFILSGTGYLETTFEGRRKHLEKGKICASLPFSLLPSYHTFKRPGVYTILRASGCRVGRRLPDRLNTQEKGPLKATEKASIEQSTIRERLVFFDQNVY